MNLTFKSVVLLLSLLAYSLFSYAQADNGRIQSIRSLDSLLMMKERERVVPKTQGTVSAINLQQSSRKIQNFSRPAINLALRTGCKDTSQRFILRKDSMIFYASQVKRAKDGSILICGESWKYGNFQTRGFIMKCDDDGNIFWLKRMDSINPTIVSWIHYYDLQELANGEIVLIGTTLNNQTQNADIILTLINNSGNLIWSKVFNSRFWGYGSGSTDYFIAKQFCEDPATGDIFVAGQHFYFGRSISRFKRTNGSIVWSRYYDLPSGINFDKVFGMQLKGNDLICFGNFVGYSGSVVSVYVLNKNNGDTIKTKFLEIPYSGATAAMGYVTCDQFQILNNGNYALSGRTNGGFVFPGLPSVPNYHAGITILDQNFNFVRGYLFRNSAPANGYNTLATVFPDGSSFFAMIEFLPGLAMNSYLVQAIDGQVVKQRKRYYSGPILPWELHPLRTRKGSDLLIRSINDSSATALEFLDLHVTDTSSACLGTDDNTTFTEPLVMQDYQFSLQGIVDNVFKESVNKSLVQTDTTLDYIVGCKQRSVCDSVKLTVNSDTLCAGQPLILHLSKNKECGAIPMFTLDTIAIKSFKTIDDSTFELRFHTSWDGYVYASVPGCSIVKDSAKIKVLASPDFLNLGPDTTLCPGNKIQLNSHTGFATYLWQDGSIDSLFNVTQAGTYSVHAVNGCGVTFNDTIVVSERIAEFLSIGADTIICHNESLTLHATPGFNNYQWSPAYNISALDVQTVKVNPAVDTTYILRAEFLPGCFSYDTIKIRVKSPLPISLGPDQNLCMGDSVTLDAGGGFQHYEWSNGSVSQQITVRNKGTYQVAAIDVSGCTSRDTMTVSNVYNLPIVNLGQDSVICAGTTKMLFAGNFSHYAWNSGDTSSSLYISQTGHYSVTVTDQYGCLGSGELNVTQLINPPSKFLPHDTTICSYGSLELEARERYSAYLWNTQNNTPRLNVDKPGIYWLEVHDKSGCIGRDSIVVDLKDCMSGFFIPSAFTPNHDGKNDSFRPLLFGHVEQYEFTIFNRWGQLVFRSTELGKGWDGVYQNKPQDNNTFIWVCRFQIKGEPVVVKKGTVVLIK